MRSKKKTVYVAAKRYIPGRRHSVDTDLICIAVRVAVTCMVFAYIVYAPLRCRYKHNVPVTCLLVLLLIAITVAVTILFLSPDVIITNTVPLEFCCGFFWQC